MSVRVLDDEPGYALFVFDKPTDSPSLKLSIKSLHVGQGCYLDPSGAWLKAPHFFSGQRVQAPDGRFGYRVGPELVNHMLDQDWIEVSSEDGTFCEQGVWENASPLMNPRGIIVQTTSPLPLTSPSPPPPPAPPPPDAVSPSSPPLPVSTPSKPAGSRKFPRWLPVAVLLTLLLVPLAVLALVPDLRCRFLGVGCPALESSPDQSERDMARQARQCAQSKEVENESCAIDSDCLMPYRRKFANGPSKPDIDLLAARAADLCQKAKAETRLFSAARQCATANPCGAPGCYNDYMRSYPDGAHAREARAHLANARRDCRPSVKPEPGGPARLDEPPLPNGVYGAQTRAGCGAPRQFGISVTVHDGQIKWQHDAPLVANGPPVTMLWEGSIDRDGNIKASVGDSPEFTARGRYFEAEREVAMHYPNCAEPVILTISGKRTK